jgi:4-amino-4-deoxy-L-arabinose transferase-like glycosyltransferase
MRLIAPQRPLLWIVLGALVLRLAAAVWLQHVLDVQQRHFLITGDAEGYWELGREIAQGEPYQLYDPPRRVERMPGYPAFVAASIRLSEAWGISPERQYFVARLLLAVVGTLNCWLVARLGRELFDEPTGNLAAAIAAIAPPLIGFSVILLSETLFATGLLLCLWSMARLTLSAAAGGGLPRLLAWAALTGLSIALAVYVRPSWLLAAPGCAVLFALWMAKKHSVVRGLVPAAAVVLVAYGALVPWAERNHRVTGHWVFTTLWVGPSLYDGFNPHATGDSDLKFVDDDRLSERMSEYDVDQHYRTEAWRFVREHPGRAAWLTLEKIKRYWMMWPNAKQFAGVLPKIAIAAYFIPLLLAAVGGWLAGPRNVWAWTLTLGPILYFAAIHSLFLGSLRYRLPAEYPLCIASAVGLQLAWRYFNRGPNRAAGTTPASPASA